MKSVSHAPRWRALSIEKTLSELGVDAAVGLTNAEILEHRASFGANQIPEPRYPSIAALWLRQFKSPLIGILLCACAILLLIDHTSDAAVIAIVVALNSIIGASHELRAQRTVRALKKLSPHTALVRRDGVIKTIAATDLVRGDIILLSEGARIAADARLLETQFLRVDESLLTGESIPIAKSPDSKSATHDQLDAPTLVFAGTVVTHGTALAAVIDVGRDTKLGAITSSLRESRTPIPLEKDIAMLSKIVVAVIGALLVIVISLGTRTTLSFTEILFIATALAISAIPEGLPAVLTIVLATGMRRMAHRNVLVKKLFAVEALGQANVLALDKTGTLTFNQMMVVSVWTLDGAVKISGEGYAPTGSFFVNDALCELTDLPHIKLLAEKLPALSQAKITRHENGTYIVSGDPTEAALSVLTQKMNVTHDAAQTRRTFAFDYERRYSCAEIALDETTSEFVVSGAPEIIVTACSTVRAGGKNQTQPMNSHERGALAAQLETMAEQGLRVVAVASKRARAGEQHQQNLREFTFEGFIGIMDAVRPEAAAMVHRAKSAGLRVVMITGDLPTTARAIAHTVGIFERGDHLLTGKELHTLPDAELRALLPRVSVFARVTPEDKLHIVQLYQKSGRSIAMTGDGVNDAPSLVAADLGIAMGRSGTDVARQAADILLLNDNLESINAAIDEGRALYQTLRKVLIYLFATNFGEICIIATAFALKLPIPVTAIQIIWLNVVTDGFLDVALALEPKDAGDAIPKLKRSRFLLHAGDFVSIIVTGAIMTIGTLFIFMRHSELPLATRQTAALIVMALFQWVHAWAIRTDRRSFFQTSLTRNPYLIGATVIVIALQIAAVTIPFLKNLLGTTALAPSIWLEAAGVALSLLVVEELRKLYRRSK